MPKSNRNCAVGGCSHTQKNCPIGRFVGFPNESKQPERREAWIRLVQRGRGEEWVPTKNSRVCGCHFVGGYKVDDPRDPAYNPSIFPARPELDRRVRKAAVSRLLALQAHHLDRHKSTYPSLVTPAKVLRNDTDSSDVKKCIPDVIDLSSQAECYAQTTHKWTEIVPKREKTGDASNLVNNTASLETSGSHPVARAATEYGENANCSDIVPTLASTSYESICGAHDQLPTNTNQLESDSSQSRGWLYIDQSKPGEGNELWKRKRLLQAKRSVNAGHFQRFTTNNLKSANVFRHARSGHTRYIARTSGVSAIADQRRTANLSVPCSSKQGLPTDNQSQSHEVLISNGKYEKGVQTVLTMDGHKPDCRVLDCTHLPTEVQSRCFGFHGWSDICFCDSTVRRVTGIVPKVFNLLVSKLQGVMPGLPPHNSLLLFLMKLKTAVPFELLGKIFGITSPTACNVFIHVLSILVGPLSDLLPQPSNLSKSSATKDNSNFWICKCNVAIDCLTIPTRFHLPKMLSREMSLDSVKILVGLTSSGFAFFVSDAFVGSVSNSDILVHSALKSHLMEGGKVHLLEQDDQLQQTLKAEGFQVMTPGGSPLGKLSTDTKFFPVFESGIIKRRVDMLTEEPTVNTPPDSRYSPKVDLVDLTISEDELVGELHESVDSLPAADLASISPHINLSCKQSQGTSCFCPVRYAQSGIYPFYPSKLAQRLRTFSILTVNPESELLPFIKDVVCVCAALVNLQESDY